MPYVAIFILITIPVIIVSVILVLVVFSGMSAGGPEVAFERAVVQSGVTAIFTFFFTAASITVLSKFYRHIVGMEVPEGDEGGAAAGP